MATLSRSLEIRHLQYFMAIAETGHMTRAAALLGIQQPPLSQQIGLLERRLGVELFRRHPRGMTLTEAGRIFQVEAHKMLADIEALEKRMVQVAKGITGTVKFGFTGSAAANPLIPRALRTCRRDYPDIELVLSETPVVLDALLAGKLHCGLMRSPGTRHDALGFEILLREPVMVALPNEHPLLRKRNTCNRGALSLLDLRDEGFVVSRQPGAPGFYSTVIDLCRKRGFEPRIVAEVERVMTNLNLVAAGAGVTIVPASMKSVHNEAIEYRPLAEQLDSPLMLAWRKEVDAGAIATFLGVLRGVAASPSA